MEGESIAEALASIGRSFASPAKIAFIGYVVLAYSGKIATGITQFIVVAAVFFLLQMFHDDYFRIVLNNWGAGSGKR
jgi:hypothetical protein